MTVGASARRASRPTAFAIWPVTINNGGSCPLLVTGITSTSSEFQLPQVLNFPVAVAPGDSVAVPIRFQPTAPGAKSATLTFASNDPATPAMAVSVSGIAPPAYVCQPPVFAAVDGSVGPTWGTGRTGNYTVTTGGRFLGSFGPQRTFAVQAEGDYRFYPGRQEGPAGRRPRVSPRGPAVRRDGRLQAGESPLGTEHGCADAGRLQRGCPAPVDPSRILCGQRTQRVERRQLGRGRGCARPAACSPLASPSIWSR